MKAILSHQINHRFQNIPWCAMGCNGA